MSRDPQLAHDRDSSFIWNYFLLANAFGEEKVNIGLSDWILPIIHGYVEQASEYLLLLMMEFFS